MLLQKNFKKYLHLVLNDIFFSEQFKLKFVMDLSIKIDFVSHLFSLVAVQKCQHYQIYVRNVVFLYAVMII